LLKFKSEKIENMKEKNENCLDCDYCKLNPYGKSDDKDYTGYHCTWIGKKICDEKDLTEISRIPNWCRKK
jgi:hypothetical protein